MFDKEEGHVPIRVLRKFVSEFILERLFRMGLNY